MVGCGEDSGWAFVISISMEKGGGVRVWRNDGGGFLGDREWSRKEGM